MLEKMADFFESRLDGYDEHMLTNIESADEFYPYTAKQLTTTENCHILDLGCGTGLELEEYFLLNPSARITGIDLSGGMLSALKKKFSDKEEQMHRQNLISLKAEQGISDNEFYHYDTPLTVKHETDALMEAGFSSALVLKNWGATYTIKAVK